ncbi:MAG: opacity protein-like surface antigen [Alphaproteobacteria bacterium]|jgi:opacity protein-like surface antigen
MVYRANKRYVSLPLLVFMVTLWAIFTALFSTQAMANKVDLKVSTAFINIHSGPGSEFPIFHVLSQGEVFTLKKERTGWYKVSTKRDINGWIKAESLANTELVDGTQVSVNTGNFEDYLNRNWEITAQAGAIDKVTALSVSGAWVWTKNLAIEATYSQALGNFADNKIWSIRMRQTFFPDWHVSPYLALGTGEIRTKPRSNLVQSGDEVRKSSHYEVGLGAEYYFAQKVVVKAEYRGLLALTDRDEQERLDHWILGVTVFF